MKIRQIGSALMWTYVAIETARGLYLMSEAAVAFVKEYKNQTEE